MGSYRIGVIRIISIRVCILLALLFLTPSVYAADIIVPDDYPSIQDAIDAANDGDVIIVRDGVYSVYLNINKSITLSSENGTANCILEASTNDDVIEVHADYVNITGFTIKNGNDDGIDVEPYNSDPSNHVNISGNVFYNLYGGIQLEDANFSVIMNNNISAVTEGIYYVGSSYHNLIVNNTISNSDYGINIPAGNDSEIYLNKFINNSRNAWDCGSNYWNSTEMHDYIYQGNAFTNYTGNYWDDYTGIDANGDGIGDIPYNISDEFCGGEGGGGEGDGIVIIGEGASSQPKDYYPMLFETLAPPQILNIQESDLANSSITISWDVSLISNNRILYSLNEDLSSPAWSEWDNNTANPSITLSGLLANTTYYYSVYSYRIDNASIYSNSSIRDFTTIRNPKTWYVDDDGLNCSADFTTIQDAVNASIDGDTIVVCNGSYNENIFVNRSLNITGLANPIVDAGYNGSAFTLASDGNIIQGFTIKNTSFFAHCYGSIPEAGVRVGYTTYQVVGAGDCIQITDHESTDNVIRNNIFINSGIVLVKGYIQSGSDRNTIVNNTFNASRIEIEGSSYNNITSNTFTGETHYGYISIEGLSYRSARNNLIHGNTFTKHYESTMPMLWIKGYASHTNISNNTLIGYGGISVSSGDCVITNNEIEGFTPIRENDDGILINHASNCLIANNSVKEKYAGIKIDSSSPYAFSTNLTLRSNNLQSNTYDFYFNPGKVQDFTNSPSFPDFDHDIDLSNNVSGGTIYFLKNVSNAVFDQTAQPAIGFFACVNCENVTVRDIGLSSNSHGVLLYNTSDSVIDSVGVYYNHLAGVAIYSSNNITIINSRFEENGQSNYASGIYIGASENITIENDEINSNWCYGIKLETSNNSAILSSNITDNGPSYYVPPANNPCYPSGIGIKMYDSDNNTIKTNYIKAIVIPKQGTWKGGQGYGIHSTSSSNNLIYNNYFFNHSVNAYDTGVNRWNTTKTAGVNIVGGPYLGGNYWHDYAGADTIGGDGLGDTLLPYNSNGNIQNGGDYHPLTSVVADTTAPSIHVVSPVESGIYSASYVYLEVYSPDPDVYRWWYSLNGGANVTFTPNTTITDLTNGNYSLTVFVNDTAGNVNSTTVNFTISITTGGGVGGVGGAGGGTSETPLEEVTQPNFEITILSPESKEYLERDLQLSFTSPVPLLRASLIVDGGDVDSISISAYATFGSVELTRLHLGKHEIIVNGEDYYGRKGRGEVEFEIIPLTLGEFNVTGTETTPCFVDDVAFSFYGRNTDYSLEFEAKGEARIGVHVNEYYREGIQPYNNLSGGLIYSFTPTPTYQKYEIPISADNITADVENIISFVSENTGNINKERGWEIKNVTLIPSIPFTFPQITVFTFNKAISENEIMTAYLRIDGVVNSTDYKAYVYLLTPEGKKLYYPDWNEDEKSIDDYYLRTNYYGKLPSTLKFSNFSGGTYILVGKIVDRLNQPVSLSTDKLYYSKENSVKLYVNKGIFNEGQEVIVEHMLTGRGEDNGTLIISLENPDGQLIYLPMLSEKQKGREYNPIRSDYSIPFNEFVNNWKEGTYIIRSNLYNESGGLIDDDIVTFEVCSKTSTLEGSYLRRVEDNDNSSFFLSRVRVIDYYTLETSDSEFKGDHFGYFITLKPGKYYLTGEAYSRSGKAYYIPLTPISVGCGENKTRNLELEYLSKANVSAYGERASPWRDLWKDTESELGLISLNSNSNLNPIKLEGESNTCSKPKVAVLVSIQNEYALNMLRDDMKLLYGEEGYESAPEGKFARYFAFKVVEMLKANSPDVDVYSITGLLDSLTATEDQLSQTSANPDASKISPNMIPDYIYKVSISGEEDLSYYSISTSLTAIPSYVIVNPTNFFSSFVSDPLNEIRRIIHRTGDLRPLIDDFEIKHPVPPRDPRLEITVVPESVSPNTEKSKKATIHAKVIDCRGRPVIEFSNYGVLRRQEVYFQKYTDRGVVKADWEATKVSMYGEGDWEIVRAKNWVIGDTREGGVAIAKYTLEKGIKAGEDRVKIITYGRGMKKASGTAVIKISGVGMDVKADKEEIPPKHSTFVEVFLYEETEDGKTKPLAGKSIIIGKVQLLDGRLIPVSSLDANGNPVTDENGIAKLKFTAGKKEGVVRIPIKYQTKLGEIHDTALIKVKEKEFVLFITWTANSLYTTTGTETRQSSCRELCCPPDEDECHWESSSGSYSENIKRIFGHSYYFTSQTTWKQGTKEERTTATFIRTKHKFGERDWGSSGSRCEASWSGSGTSQYSYEGSASSQVSDAYSEIVFETRSGDLLLCIDPIQYPVFLMKGSGTESFSSSYSSGSESYSGSTSFSCQYDGDPSTKTGCFTGFAERVRVWVPYSWITKKPGLNCFILKKVGKDKWEEVNADINPKNSRSGSGTRTYTIPGTWPCTITKSYSSNYGAMREAHLEIRVVKR
ncbi:MAG: right-handed parallel beta-helix repeat-containing protein [Archaeoglobus sp.]|nr:right-handed parallel beta-helix repeat-containing protein [Archaeoglobus sp.]